MQLISLGHMKKTELNQTIIIRKYTLVLGFTYRSARDLWRPSVGHTVWVLNSATARIIPAEVSLNKAPTPDLRTAVRKLQDILSVCGHNLHTMIISADEATAHHIKSEYRQPAFILIAAWLLSPLTEASTY